MIRRLRNLSENPHLAALFLEARVQEFLLMIKKLPQFKYQDYWYRYEWQHRGSGHVHGFLWFENAPLIDEMNLNNERDRQTLSRYFSQFIHAEIPIAGLLPAHIHPCQK